jgi:hypothetical protein
MKKNTLLNRLLIPILISSYLLSFALPACAEEGYPITATERLKNISNEEVTWRYIGRGVNLTVGSLGIYAAASLFNTTNHSSYYWSYNPFGFYVILFGLVSGGCGVALVGWATYDILFGTLTYTNAYERVLTVDKAHREAAAAKALKNLSDQDKNSQLNILSLVDVGAYALQEKPAIKSYREYLNDHPELDQEL